MSHEISMLENAILNLQCTQQAVVDQLDTHHEKIADEVRLRINKLPGSKKVSIKIKSFVYDGKNLMGGLSIKGLIEGEANIAEIVVEAGTPYYEGILKLTKRYLGLAEKAEGFMSELAKFTEVETVIEGSSDHVHLFTVRQDKIYTGQLYLPVPPLPFVYLCNAILNPKKLEKAVRETNCPLYIAKHPSAVASHQSMTKYAVKEILKAIKDKEQK